MSQEKIERWNEVHGNDAPQDKLTAFMDSTTDSYAILQLRRTEDTIMERFMDPEDRREVLEDAGLDPDEFDF